MLIVSYKHTEKNTDVLGIYITIQCSLLENKCI